ncbi:HYR-like domain-containing protein, partial [Salinimicrobium flavum]
MVVDAPDPLTCEGTRTYTWTFTDCEGNTADWSYVYTIEYEPFTISEMDGSETVACEADADGVGITLPTVMDNCGNPLTAGTPVVVDAPDPLTCE